MNISSPAFENGQPMPKKYKSTSPALIFTNVPEGTVSMALVVHDPDAPAGGFTHWLVWNIPSETTDIEEGRLPEKAVQGKNDAGRTSWVGPAPPNGTHRYFFNFYALNQNLYLPAGSNKDDFDNSIADKIIAQAELMGTFSA